MKKRLTAQGPKDRKSYTVTLPIEWVKKEGLDKSRIVELDIIGKKIIISTHKDKPESVTLDGDTYYDGLLKVLQGLYRIGVNEVKLKFSDTKVIKKTIDIIETKLIGFEIIEQKKDYILIKDITRESSEDFMVIFRRIFLLLMELSESKTFSQAMTIDRNIKKLINYCQRILMKKGHSEFTKTPLYYLILDRLEKIKDEYSWLLEITTNQKRPHPRIKQINELLRIAYEIFYKYDAKKYDTNIDKTHRIRNTIKLENNMKKEHIHIHNIARLLNSLYGDIFTLKFKENNKPPS